MKNISNPFTPKSGWEPRVFLGRQEEIEMFNKKLDDAINGRCDHFLVLGDWGIGKTSLLKRFKKTAQLRNILTSFITVREFQKGDKFIQATEQLTTEIPRELPIKHEKLKNFIDYLSGLGISLPVVGGGIQIPMEVELRGDPQTLLLDSLINLWNDVLFSTPDGWRQFLQKHHPIGRYFIPRLTLNNLSRDEAIKIVDKTLEETGVVLKDIIAIVEKNKLGLSKNTIATSLTRLVDKRILIKPEKFKYYLSDKLFREYILRYRGYDGNGSLLRLKA